MADKTFWDNLPAPTVKYDPRGKMTQEQIDENNKILGQENKYLKYDDGKFSGEDIGVASYDALNSMLLGVPDVLVKSSSSDTYKKLQAMRERNKLASGIGMVGGLVADAPLAATKLLSKGALKLGSKGAKIASAADKASDFLGATGVYKDVKGLKGVAQGAGRGAVQSGAQVAPRLLSGETDLKDAGLAVALGSGIGGVASVLPSISRSAGLINKGEDFTKPLTDSLVDAELAARGFATKDIKRAMNETARNFGLNKTGHAINNADDVKKSLLKVLKENDILNADEGQAFIQGTGKKFEALDDVFEKSGTTIGSLRQEIMDDPVVKNYVQDYGQSTVDAFIKKLDSKDTLMDIKQALTGEIKFANKSTDRAASEFGDVAHSIKNVLEDRILAIDPMYRLYKEDWKNIQPLRQFVANEKMGISRSSAGSDTASKQAMINALNKTGSGSNIIGNVVGTVGGGVALQGFDPEDSSTWTPSALKLIGGIVAGAALNKGVNAGVNYGKGAAASAINKAGIMDALSKIGFVANKADIPALLERITAVMRTEETPQETREELGEIQPDEKVIQAQEKYTEETGFKPQEAEAAVEKEAKYGPVYMDKLTSKMRTYWEKNFAKTMTFEDYVAAVGAKTDGFSPQKAAVFLYSDKKERAKFLRDLGVSAQLQDINLDEIYSKNQFGISKEDKALKAKKQLDLVNMIASLVTNEGDVPTKVAIDTIKADIAAITALPANAKEKRDILIELLSNKYSLGYQDLVSMGLV